MGFWWFPAVSDQFGRVADGFWWFLPHGLNVPIDFGWFLTVYSGLFEYSDRFWMVSNGL